MSLFDTNGNLILEHSFSSVAKEKLRNDAYMCPRCLKIAFKDDTDLLKLAKRCKCEGFLENGITKITDLKQLGRRKEFVNRLGMISKRMQGIDFAVTSIKRFTCNSLTLYIYAENSIPMGFIATGYYDNEFMATDFMVMLPYQRRGIGKKLIDYVLIDTGISINDILFDQPSRQCLNMIKKHYNLSADDFFKRYKEA